MAEPIVAHDDLELFLVKWFREVWFPLQGIEGVVVDRVEPDEPPFPAALLVIRDDGGPDTGLLTGERSLGLTVLAGTKAHPKPAKDLMRVVLAGIRQVPGTDVDLVDGLRNPVAAVLETFGPTQVPEEQDRARIYAPVTLAVTAAPL